MPRISNVVWPKYNMRYGYLFDIQSILELAEYFEVVRVPASNEEYIDAVHSHEGGNPRGNHATKGAVLVNLARLKETSIVEALGKLNFDLMAGMQRAIEERGRIFINSNGGYFVTGSHLEITDTKEIPKFILPEEKARIISWPNGKHFYAKVGNTDVVVNGKQKWDTREEAEQAAKEFLK